MDKSKMKEIRKQVRSAEIRNDLEYANSQPNENELMEKKIDNHEEVAKEYKELQKKIDSYIEWFKAECSDTHEELEWLIDLLLNSKHKEDIEQVLEDNYNK